MRVRVAIPVETVQLQKGIISWLEVSSGYATYRWKALKILFPNVLELFNSKKHTKSYDQKSRRDSFFTFLLMIFRFVFAQTRTMTYSYDPYAL